MIRRFPVLALLVAAFGLGTAPAARAAEFTFSAPQTETAQLVLYSTTDLVAMRPIIETYQRRNPGTTVHYFELLTPEIYDLVRETRTVGGRRPDVVISTAMDMQFKLVNDGYALRHESPQTAQLPQWANWRNEAFGFTFEPAVIVYNPEILPPEDIPSTRFDLVRLLREKAYMYRGRVASYDITKSGAGYLFATQDALQAHTYGRLLESFGRTEIQLAKTTGAMLDAIARGEVLVGYNLLGSFQRPAAAYDVRQGDPHGTWVAISIAGDDTAHLADASNPLGPHHDFGDGVAPLAKLVIEDLGDESGELVGLDRPLPRRLDQMFEQMRDAGARIATNSWGTEGNAYDLLAFFADRMAYQHPDFLLVFSAGNSGPYPGTLASPGTSKNGLTVGASDARIDGAAGLDPENVASFSARGPTSDGRLKPDLVMSGNKLVTGHSDFGETGRSCDTLEVTGTSFASPLVAGFAALAREYYRKGFYPTGAARTEDAFLPSAALLKATLIAGARNMAGKGGDDHSPCNIDTCDTGVGLCRNEFIECREDADCRRCSGDLNLRCNVDRDCDLSRLQDDAPTTEQGWGRLHLDDALFFAGDARGLRAWDVPRESGLGTGETFRAEFSVEAGSEDLQVVLTWPDPPALVASPTFLVNDLDLKVTAPDGTVYWGNAWNTRDRSPFTRETTKANERPGHDVDNVEMVRLAGHSLASGLYTLEIIGESVPGTPLVDDGGARQDFAVVAVGPVSANGGTLNFDAAQSACAGEVSLTLLDANATGTRVVELSTSSGDLETLTLVDQGGGRFTGSLALASGTPIATASGALEITDGELIRARYDDDAPVQSAHAETRVACSAALQPGSPEITGGCDDDGFLDAGESVELEVPLINAGSFASAPMTVRLVSDDADVFVEVAEASYPAIAPGTAGTPGTPFRVALREDAVRATRTFTLELRPDGSGTPELLSFEIEVETDTVSTNGSWSEDFSSGSLSCHDGSSAAPLDQWYFFDLDQNCATDDDTWEFAYCEGDNRAVMPSCFGTWVSPTSETHHRLVTPHIVTGEAGSTTVLKTLRFRETYHFELNADGKPCDRALVELFTNRDGRVLPTGYYRDRSADGSDELASLDLTALAEYQLPPVPDATELQLVFHAASNDRSAGATSCTGSSGDEYRWRLDDVELLYENVRHVDDQATCTPSCSAPSVASGVTAVAWDEGRALVGWDAPSDPAHFELREVSGSEPVLLTRVPGDERAALVDLAGEGPWTIEVVALDASGLCPAAGASAAPLIELCREAPAPPSGFRGQDAATSTCEMELLWDATSAPCGGPLRYRVYRGDAPGFPLDPSRLLGETSGTSLLDTALETGFDDAGEPVGTAYEYALVALDEGSGLASEAVRWSGRAGGPRSRGTWLDDGGDTALAKLSFETTLDENDAGAGWSRTPFSVVHSGSFAYWSDAEASGDGRYPALACFALVSPEIELDTSAPELRLFVNHEIEYEWDGLVIELDDGSGFAPIAPVGGYPGTFAQTLPPPCQGGGSGGTGSYVNGCDYPPSQGAITGPELGGLSGWQEYVFDLSSWAGTAIRFRTNLSTDCGTAGGVVIDDVRVEGALLPSACAIGSCAPMPRFAGLVSATDGDPASASGVELSWGEVEDWGGGGPGHFELYRDGALLTSLGAEVRSHVDTTALTNRDHRYQVVAVSGGSCALRSPGAATLSARDCGTPGSAEQESARLSVALSDDADQVVLRARHLLGAGRFVFPWSTSPDDVASSPTALESAAPEARHAVGGDAANYFYLVRGESSPACP